MSEKRMSHRIVGSFAMGAISVKMTQLPERRRWCLLGHLDLDLGD